MSETPKISRVGIKVEHGGQTAFGIRYLVIRAGQHWCYANEEDIDKPPHEVGGLLLDPLLLEPQPMPYLGAPLYYYRETFLIS